MKSMSQPRSDVKHERREMARAAPAQVAFQFGVILLLLVLWTGLLVAFLNLTGESGAPVAEPSRPTEVVAAPEATPTPGPTNLPPSVTATATLPEPTDTPEATSIPTKPAPANASPTALASKPPAATSSPTALPTELPTASSSPTAIPTATETAPSPTDTPAPPAASISFARDVLPILTSRCRRCHGDEDDLEAGLYLLSHAGVMAGSENGAVLIPGDSQTSLLVEQLINGEMPKRSPRLPSSEIETIGTWVDEGALDN